MRMNAAVLRSLGRLSLSILGVGCILSVSTAALAVPITYNFTGTVQVLTFGWGTATAGDAITGTFTFDDGLTDAIASDGAAKYSTAASTAGISGSLTAGGFTIMADSASDPTASFLQLFDDSPSDNFTFSVEEMNLSLNQLGGGTSLAGLLDGVNVDPISTAVTVLNGIDPADFRRQPVDVDHHPGQRADPVLVEQHHPGP
jgi:hypothetical protein